MNTGQSTMQFLLSLIIGLSALLGTTLGNAAQLNISSAPCSAAAGSECRTETPSGGGGWTAKGKKCKNPNASCGTLKVCATSKHQDHLNKVATYSCNCLGAISPSIQRYSSLADDLFSYSVPSELYAEVIHAAGLRDLAAADTTLTIRNHSGRVIYQGQTRFSAHTADWAIPRLDNGEYEVTIQVGDLLDAQRIYLNGPGGGVGTLP